MHVKVRIFRKNAETRIFLSTNVVSILFTVLRNSVVVRALCGISTVAVSSTRHACESAHFFKRVFCEFDNLLLLRDRLIRCRISLCCNHP